MKVSHLFEDRYPEKYVLTQDYVAEIVSGTGRITNDLRAGTILKIVSLRSPYVYFSAEGQDAIFITSKTIWNEYTFKGTLRDWHKKFMGDLREEVQHEAGEKLVIYVDPETLGLPRDEDYITACFDDEDSKDQPFTNVEYLDSGTAVTFVKYGLDPDDNSPAAFFKIDDDVSRREYWTERRVFDKTVISPEEWRNHQRKWMNDLRGRRE